MCTNGCTRPFTKGFLSHLFGDAEDIVGGDVQQGAEPCKGVEGGENVLFHILGDGLRGHAYRLCDVLLFY